VLVCSDLLEGLTYEKEDLIFETEPKLFSTSTITILDETISLLSIRMSKIKTNEKSDPKQKTIDQGEAKVVLLPIKPKDFYVRPKISLEDKVYPKTYYRHRQANIEVDETPTKI
jgi:hypothetical protein